MWNQSYEAGAPRTATTKKAKLLHSSFCKRDTEINYSGSLRLKMLYENKVGPFVCNQVCVTAARRMSMKNDRKQVKWIILCFCLFQYHCNNIMNSSLQTWNFSLI